MGWETLYLLSTRPTPSMEIERKLVEKQVRITQASRERASPPHQSPIGHQSTELTLRLNLRFSDKHLQAHNIAGQCERQFLGIGYPQSCRLAGCRVLYVSARSSRPPNGSVTGESLMRGIDHDLVLFSLPPPIYSVGQ
jgi:hypothetical protein